MLVLKIIDNRYKQETEEFWARDITLSLLDIPKSERTSVEFDEAISELENHQENINMYRRRADLEKLVGKEQDIVKEVSELLVSIVSGIKHVLYCKDKDDLKMWCKIVHGRCQLYIGTAIHHQAEGGITFLKTLEYTFAKFELENTKNKEFSVWCDQWIAEISGVLMRLK